MVATDVHTQKSSRGRSVPRIVSSILLGVAMGIVAYYLIAVAATAQIPGNFTINPLALVMVAVVGAGAVVASWRWPTTGLTAGVLILLLVGLAVAGRMAWSSSSADWLNPFNAVAFGAASGYPALLGAVLTTVSALQLRSRKIR
ncbi:hypothetical protein [Leifsonia aquatica]|uniref:hypothetical protein n=1 Tax=Leifsonia aquatica TaxID=144185 RepID=UPI00046B04BF|nr:hypothetical protein [Leifsonia aquatica]